MKKGSRNFWQRKQTMLAGVIMVAAAVLMTCMAVIGQKEDSQQQELAQRQETIEQEKNDYQEGNQDLVALDTESPEEEEEDLETAPAAAFIEPFDRAAGTDSVDTEEPNQSQQEASAPVESDAGGATKSVAATVSELHFSPDTGLLWPLEGSVIMNYSMDQTIYFATLEQYKYNPAVIISGAVNDKVKAAAAGKVTDISTNEETGCTLSMDLGDGYTAIYGQLKETPYQVGDYVAAGNTIGFVSEPTKYYSVEGSNLFFELQKDGAPVDPIEFFQ